LNVPLSDAVNLHLSEVREQVIFDDLFVAHARAGLSIREILLEEGALHAFLEGQGGAWSVHFSHLHFCQDLLQAAVSFTLGDFIFVA
jgi:hypothetical protein